MNAEERADLYRFKAERLEAMQADLDALMDARLTLEATHVDNAIGQNALANAIQEIEEAEQHIQSEMDYL